MSLNNNLFRTWTLIIALFPYTCTTVYLHRAQAPLQKLSQPAIGILTVAGAMNDHTPFINLLQDAINNPQIQGIIIFVNSGGGASSFGDIAHNLIKQFQAKKPIITFVEGMCASAAYHLACAGKIMATPASSIGSIGTFLPIDRHREVKFKHTNGEKGSLERIILKRGKHKALWHPNTTDLTDEEIMLLETDLDKHYEHFCTSVARSRNLAVETIKNTEARVYDAEEALTIGLIDAIGTREDAFNLLKQQMLEQGLITDTTIDLQDNIIMIQ